MRHRTRLRGPTSAEVDAGANDIEESDIIIDIGSPVAERGRGAVADVRPDVDATPDGEAELIALADLGAQMMLAQQVDDRLRLAAHAVGAHLSRPVAAGLHDGTDSVQRLVWLGVAQDRRDDMSRTMTRLAERADSNPDEPSVVRSSAANASVTAVTAGGASILVVGAPESAVPFLRAVGAILASAVATGTTSNGDLGMNLVWTAHELEAPLMTVRTAMEQAMRTRRSADRRRLLERGLRELELLSEVTDSLLRSRGGGSELQRTHSDLSAQAAEMLATVISEPHGHAVRVIAPEPVWASVDPVQFRIAVMNLIRNALRHAGGGPITVRVLREGDDAVVRVEDEGHGVPEGVRDRIFEPFVSENATGDRGGSGLGLFICKRIIERHDGSLTMDDRGGGSAFVVRLPWDDGGGEPPSAS